MSQNVPPELLEMMCGLYPDPQRARVFINQFASVPADFLSFAGPPKVMWFGLLDEIRKHIELGNVLEQAQTDYPNLDWKNVEGSLLSSTSSCTSIDLSADWRNTEDSATLEKIIGVKSTLLPIGFLEAGLSAAKSVCKVVIPGKHMGSGFLISDNTLLTNNHVIPDVEHASKAELLFNYQLTVDGRDAKVTKLRLAPDDFFRTSQADDWSAVRVASDANERWGQLGLASQRACVDDNVNIIQHPGGQPKQVAIHDNLVRYVDETRIQYLTDTMGGSSGSPVFNLVWDVVAIHHSGGLMREPSSPHGRSYFRNEGIPIEVIRRGIT